MGGESSRMVEATTRLFDVLLTEDAPSTILDSLARIVGETLGVDRSLIYDASFTRDIAECLTEWLNPQRPEITTTKANYPIALFRGAAEQMARTRDPVASHARAPNAMMLSDGSAPILHGDMKIASLLWYPFAFRDDGFYLLAFNHVDMHHDWDAAELEFMRTATRHVSMALLKIELIRQRAHAEEVLFEAQKLESLGILAGGVAHDFNNLMVGVVTGAELLARRLPRDSPMLELVGQILHSGRRASALAGQLLAFSGKGQPDETTADFAQIVKSTIGLVRSSLGNATLDLDVVESAAIDGNVSQLEQVVMNLVVNASEAMQSRTGGIRVKIDRLELDERGGGAYVLPGPLPAGRYVRLDVSDDGGGMDSRTMTRIFDPFFSTKRAGRGLGLSAVIGIVKHHRGAIRISSSVGVGTTFEVLFPVSGRQIDAVRPPALDGGRDGQRRTVLCIDDDAEVLHAVTNVLEDAGFVVLAAIGGAQGIAIYKERAATIDCVLLDLTMPQPGGREVMKVLRGACPSLPIVLMSGFTTDERIQDVIDPITQFIKKPFLANSLEAAILGVLVPRVPPGA